MVRDSFLTTRRALRRLEICCYRLDCQLREAGTNGRRVPRTYHSIDSPSRTNCSCRAPFASPTPIRCAPAVIIPYQEGVLGRLLDKMSSDVLAERMIPQARKVVAMREARNKYLHDETFLGRCRLRLEEYGREHLMVRHHGSEIEFEVDSLNELDRFLGYLPSEVSDTVVFLMINLLDHMMHDLENRSEARADRSVFCLSNCIRASLSVGNWYSPG